MYFNTQWWSSFVIPQPAPTTSQSTYNTSEGNNNDWPNWSFEVRLTQLRMLLTYLPSHYIRKLYLRGLPFITSANHSNDERQSKLSCSKTELHQTVVRLDILKTNIKHAIVLHHQQPFKSISRCSQKTQPS